MKPTSANFWGNWGVTVKAFFCGLAIGLAALIAGIGQVAAQMQGPVDMITALEPERTGPTVRALKTQNSLNVQAHQQLPPAYDFPSINLNVGFDGESHLLTAEGMRTLRTLAVAMQDPKIKGQTFQVAGHVFIQNSGAAQFPLSARRAQAVVDHLVVYYGIPRAQLTPVGYGANKPYNMANPYGAENTRIEIINLSEL